MAESYPPAGWYADPENPDAQRYWDGEAWTDDITPGGPTEPSWQTDAADPNLQRFWDGHDWSNQTRPNPGPWMPTPVPKKYNRTNADLRGPAVGLGIAAFAVAYAISSMIQPGWLDASDATAGATAFLISWAAALTVAGLWCGLHARSATEWPVALLAFSSAVALFATGLGMYGDQDSAGLALFLIAGIAVIPAMGVAALGLNLGAGLRSIAVARYPQDGPSRAESLAPAPDRSRE